MFVVNVILGVALREPPQHIVSWRNHIQYIPLCLGPNSHIADQMVIM